MSKYVRYEYYGPERSYGFIHHLFDFVMVILTGGLWLIWILLRHLARSR